MLFSRLFAAGLGSGSPLVAQAGDGIALARPKPSTSPIDKCPGYKATNILQTGTSFAADLTLAGDACNTYGDDLKDLKLQVEYQTENRLHVHIYDAAQNVYQVPESVLPRPGGFVSASKANLHFSIVEEPFSFAVSRISGDGPALFNTTGWDLVFQSQHWRLKTQLPDSPNIYGLGEHSDPFRLPTDNHTRTLWGAEAINIPTGHNLYGSHPVYFEHRGAAGTHGVFLANSDGMDINVNKTEKDGQFLEYNVIGGTIDLYFMAGPTPSDVAVQYAEVVGKPQLPPYWSFGFHQCKYGYRDVYEQAEIIANFSNAGIPLETMWSDIDYMDLRKIFTTDPERYPKDRFRTIIDILHSHQQHSVFMTNAAIARQDYGGFNDAVDTGVLLKSSNGSDWYTNVVWPGPAVFVDWFHPRAQEFWTDQIQRFYNATDGFDIDGMWIDMNEASVFCPYPCEDPWKYAKDNKNPPEPPPVRTSADGRPIPGFPPEFQPGVGADEDTSQMSRRAVAGRPIVESRSGERQIPVHPMADAIGLPNRDLITPPYKIRNALGEISTGGIATDVKHSNGMVEYDTHNLFGRMMSQKTRVAMQARRPGRRTMIISRNTWPGTGTDVGHWLGDNESTWPHYRVQLTGLLQFSAIYQIPLIGSDVCGFNGNTTEQLCARWAMLAAFAPFYRNHAEISANHQEFFLWESVTAAAKKAIDARFRLMDYMYGHFARQSETGVPFVVPMWYIYPSDANTFGIEYQYFYGPNLLISPVLEEDRTSVEIYLPKDKWYDFWTLRPVEGKGEKVLLEGLEWTDIPVHIRGGTILPLRVQGANTTTELRKRDFRIVVAPGVDGTAKGELYLDDGEMEVQERVSRIEFGFDGTRFNMSGVFDYDAGVSIREVVLAGVEKERKVIGRETVFDKENQTVTVIGPWSLREGMEVVFSDPV